MKGALRAFAVVVVLLAVSSCANPVALDEGPGTGHTTSSGNHTTSSGNLSSR